MHACIFFTSGEKAPQNRVKTRYITSRVRGVTLIGPCVFSVRTCAIASVQRQVKADCCDYSLAIKEGSLYLRRPFVIPILVYFSVIAPLA